MGATTKGEHVLDLETTEAPPESRSPRTLVRFGVSGLAVAVAFLYYLIAFGVLDVVDEADGMMAFGLIAGTAYLAAAAVSAFFDRRLLWGAGLVVQAFIIWAYFDLASERTPSFEAWGIVVRVLQVVILGALVYLAFVPRREDGVDSRSSFEATKELQDH